MIENSAAIIGLISALMVMSTALIKLITALRAEVVRRNEGVSKKAGRVKPSK